MYSAYTSLLLYFGYVPLYLIIRVSAERQHNFERRKMYFFRRRFRDGPNPSQKLGAIAERKRCSCCLAPWHGPGQSHLIFGAGSTSHVITSQFSKLYFVDALYRPL